MTHTARTGMTIPRLRRRLGLIGFGLTIVVLLAAMVVLLPILLPALAVSEAWTVRRLARSRCVTCGRPIGLEEIRRAKQEALAVSGAIMGALLAALRRPRIVTVWDVTCPTCGHEYVYRPGDVRPALISKELGASGQAT